MAIEDDIAFLERVPTFRLLGKRALRILTIGAENVYVHTGETLFRKGEAADGAFVVQEGSFSLNYDADETTRDAIVGPGTLFGEFALIADGVRPVTATAREPSNVIRIPRNLFLRMLETYPDAARRLRDMVAKRVEESAREMTAVRTKLDSPNRSD
jgi:CRP-like cAMP-binding protein